MGFPIRKSTDQRVFAPPRSLSQRITSFIACACQGIHQLPLRHLIVLIANAPRPEGRAGLESGSQEIDATASLTLPPSRGDGWQKTRPSPRPEFRQGKTGLRKTSCHHEEPGPSATRVTRRQLSSLILHQDVSWDKLFSSTYVNHVRQRMLAKDQNKRSGGSGIACPSPSSEFWLLICSGFRQARSNPRARPRVFSRIREGSWWSQTGSNRRPPACKAGALPTELWPRRKSSEIRDQADHKACL